MVSFFVVWRTAATPVDLPEKCGRSPWRVAGVCSAVAQETHVGSARWWAKNTKLHDVPGRSARRMDGFSEAAFMPGRSARLGAGGGELNG